MGELIGLLAVVAASRVRIPAPGQLLNIKHKTWEQGTVNERSKNGERTVNKRSKNGEQTVKER